MENAVMDVCTNWTHVGGCSFLSSIQERPANPDDFIKPPLSNLVKEEKSILLSKELSSEYCELCIKLHSNYKIQAVSFVCNAAKVELFQGIIKEYFATFYGNILDEPDDEFNSYRYDVEIERSGIRDLTIRFLTDFSDICIFGIILHTAPNPNGITTLSSNTEVAIEKLATGQVNYNPDKFEKLLEVMKTHRCNSMGSDDHAQPILNAENNESMPSNKKINEDIVLDGLKSHIDKRFQEMESNLHMYLEVMEKRQNEKIDMILNLLQNINK